jgi:rare lipoprotein A
VWGATARVVALAVGCLLLANCSGPVASRSASYTPRVVEDGEPIPKGTGNYRVGKPYSINGRTYVPSDDPAYSAEGVASWYGPDFHGRLTANQEVYDMNGISAAHPTMPLPSYARVTNLDNGRSIIVRVNNRGPFVGNRIMDLSVGTARALEFYGKGLARVRVEYVGRAPVEGSDDRMLLATLRTGQPAPAPSRVMVASAKPLVPDAVTGQRPGSERPLALGGTPRITSPEPTVVGSISRSAVVPGFLSTLRGEGPSLGLLSGRGLY